MPPRIDELRDSRTFSVDVTGGTAVWRFVILGQPDEAAAYDMVLNEAPATWFGYTRSNINMDDRPNLGIWFPVVTYTIPVFPLGTPPPSGDAGGGGPPPAGGSPPSDNSEVGGKISFSLSLESQHVTRSLKSISRTGLNGATAPDPKGLVGVRADGEVDGVDIGVAVASFQVKATIPNLTYAHLKNLLYCCGRTNERPWWFFKEEEGYLVGINGQCKGSGETELSYDFRYSRTRPSVNIRPGLQTSEKRGWHYLWTMNKKEQDNVNDPPVVRPIAAYVDQIFETAEFAYLGTPDE